MNCPCCENHCDENELRCGRGASYFGREKRPHHGGEAPEMDEVIACLHKCGHYLHHNHKQGGADLTSCLTEEEKSELCALLNKCLQAWGAD